jgi:formamidopyrimidine-DNA glycosylase
MANLTWKTDAARGRRTLHVQGSKAVLATIEREGDGPMWRAVFKGGKSDYGNITRISDAAMAHVTRGQQCPACSGSGVERATAGDGYHLCPKCNPISADTTQQAS